MLESLAVVSQVYIWTCARQVSQCKAQAIQWIIDSTLGDTFVWWTPDGGPWGSRQKTHKGRAGEWEAALLLENAGSTALLQSADSFLEVHFIWQSLTLSLSLSPQLLGVFGNPWVIFYLKAETEKGPTIYFCVGRHKFYDPLCRAEASQVWHCKSFPHWDPQFLDTAFFLVLFLFIIMNHYYPLSLLLVFITSSVCLARDEKRGEEKDPSSEELASDDSTLLIDSKIQWQGGGGQHVSIHTQPDSDVIMKLPKGQRGASRLHHFYDIAVTPASGPSCHSVAWQPWQGNEGRGPYP